MKTQAILLTTYLKLLNLYPEQTEDLIKEVFSKYSTSSHLELQQRACEYTALPTVSAATMEAVLNPMPPFELESRESALLQLAVGSSHSAGNNADKITAQADNATALTGTGGAGAGGEDRAQSQQAAAPAPQKVESVMLSYYIYLVSFM